MTMSFEMVKRVTYVLSPLTSLALMSSTALSQPVEGLMKSEAATSGSTEVATTGFQQVAVETDEENNSTEFKVSAGGMFATGNSNLTALTGSSRFRARRSDNQLSAAAAANYTRTELDGESTTTVRNFQGKVRFDRFLGEGFATFLSMSGRNDKFQGLILRLNVDPGVAYYFIDKPKVQFWSELGYDYQYDLRRLSMLESALAEGILLDRVESRHSGRLFLGYDNNLNESVTFNTGVEYLQALPDTEYWRVNWDLGLTSQIANRLSINTTFSLRYDNTPLPGVKTTDTITAVNIAYQLI